MEKLRLAARAYSQPVTVHVIGFGTVNNDFLESVRKLGNRDGLFRYAVQSAELQNSFNDMFDVATARQYHVTVRGQTYTTCTNDQTVGVLLNECITDESVIELPVVVQSIDDPAERPVYLIANRGLTTLQVIKGLNLTPVDNEAQVREVIAAVNQVPTDPSLNMLQKMELNQIRKEVEDRMMEYIRLFTEIKMSQVNETVKLKLNALRHDVTFSNLSRKKALDLRVSKNVDYFKKTDIPGILTGFRDSMTQEAWAEIAAIKNDWVDVFSTMNLYEIMRRSVDNILCLGILVRRHEQTKDSPDARLELVSVSNTLISYDAFQDAMRHAKAQRQLVTGDGGAGDAYGQFEGINDTFCLVGTGQERINAVIPLYIHKEHFKRVRILEGLWLGHLFTLDSYGYDKSQEVALLKLLADMIVKTPTTPPTSHYRRMVQEIEKVCLFIINESLGFQSYYGRETYDQFVQSSFCRVPCQDVVVPLVIGYLKSREQNDNEWVDFRRAMTAVYLQKVRQTIKASPVYRKGEAPLDVARSLLYGDQQRSVLTASAAVPVDVNNPDFVEQSYIKYFRDETSIPVPLLTETTNAETRRAVVPADRETLYQFLNTDPVLAKDLPVVSRDVITYIDKFLQWVVTDIPTSNTNSTPNNPSNINNNILSMVEGFKGKLPLHEDQLRQALLTMLCFDEVPPHVQLDNSTILSVDQKLQGDIDTSVKFEESDSNMETLAYVACRSQTVDGFAGLLRKYCPKRCGKTLAFVVTRLLTDAQDPDSDSSGRSREKIVALLTNRVQHQVFYRNDEFCFQPLVPRDQLVQALGEPQLTEIEKENSRLSKCVVHRYRASNKPNQHGHSNHVPNWNMKYPFTRYAE
eukprot:GILJ01009736.1.p1 GENE.GILJ01009736.1~~GILJ01009736.1.p1  ORF type:complete len:1004 (-),score=155.62 GILJ01009736.1:340-2919(-)